MLSYAPTLLGSTTPRLWTPPLITGPPGPCGCGCALNPATSLGYSCVDFARDVLGVELLPWQRWLLIHALELRPDGRFRFRTVLILVARQNGKTTLVEVKNLWKMFVLRVLLVIGTAQNLDTSEESWDKAVEIVESIPELAVEVKHVDKTNGKKALKLVNGSRWKIAASSRRGGRGLSGDDVNLDELREHQTWDSWGAVTKTTMARRNPQVWAFSNAGDDKSIVLNDLQEIGRAAAKDPASADPTFGHFEWSAPDEVKCTCGRPDGKHTPDCRLRDPEARAQANPALGYTVTEEGLDAALTTDPEAVYRTECLCQRVKSLVEEWTVIPQAAWLAVADELSEMVGRVAFAVRVAPDRSWAAIGAAGRRADGRVHVEIIDYRAGTKWVPERAKQLEERWNPCAWVVDAGSPAGSLIADLEAVRIEKPDGEVVGLEIVKPTAREVGHAYGQFVDAVMPKEGEPTLRYMPHPALDVAVAGAVTRPLGDAKAWDAKAASVDICPLVVVTEAAWGFATRGHIEEAVVEPLVVWR